MLCGLHLPQPSIRQHHGFLAGRAIPNLDQLFRIPGFEKPRRVICGVLPVTEGARCAVYQNVEARFGVHRFKLDDSACRDEEARGE